MSESNRARALRAPLLWLAGFRAVVSIAAVPLAPFLFRKHFILLVLMRPTKEVLLAAGFLVRRHDVNPALVLVAAIPLCILGVWHFYFLGRAFSTEIQSGRGLPKWTERLLPTKRIEKLCQLLDRKGRRVIFLGRLASFPSALLGASAGASGMPAKSFLSADGAGGLVAIADVMAAGYALGAAYKKAGPWIAGIGLVALIALVVGVGRVLARD